MILFRELNCFILDLLKVYTLGSIMKNILETIQLVTQSRDQKTKTINNMLSNLYCLSEIAKPHREGGGDGGGGGATAAAPETMWPDQTATPKGIFKNLNEENKTFKENMFRQLLCHRQFADGIKMMNDI